MYSVEKFPNGTREAVLSVDGLVFKSRGYLDALYPVRPIPGMDLRVYYHSADAVAGALFWEAWDDNEALCSADTPEALLAKLRVIMVGRLLHQVETYNALFRLDVPSGPAKLFL